MQRSVDKCLLYTLGVLDTFFVTAVHPTRPQLSPAGNSGDRNPSGPFRKA
jgi:hypothetical protein